MAQTSVIVLGLVDPTVTPIVTTGHYVALRSRITSGTGTLNVELRQGAAVIESWTVGLTTSFATDRRELSPANVANITDYTDLRLAWYVSGTAAAAEVSRAYVQVPQPIATTELEVGLTNPSSVPAFDDDHYVSIRGKISSGTGSLLVSLVQGSTIIESWQMTLGTSFSTEMHALDAANVANISDYTDLRLRWTGYGSSGASVSVSRANVLFPQGVGAVNASAGVANGTGTANQPSVSVRAMAGCATSSGAAAQPRPSVGAAAVPATATGVANSGTTTVKGAGGNAPAIGTALPPAISIRIPIGLASGVGAANAPNPLVAPNAAPAAGTGTAYPATTTGTSTPTTATGSGTANNPSASVKPPASAAAGTGTANNARPNVGPNAAPATASGTANNAAPSVKANAGVATASGTANNATATTTGATNAFATTATASGSAPTASANIAPDADTATASATSSYLNLSFTMSLSGNTYLYRDMADTANYTVVTGDVLEYDVYWQTNNALIGMDLTTTDSFNLRDSSAVDQNGLDTHPNTVGVGTYANGQWYSRQISLTGVGIVGKTISFFDVVCEYDAGGTIVGRIRNARITNAGVEQRRIWMPGDALPNHTLHLQSSSNTLNLTVVDDHYDPRASVAPTSTTATATGTANNPLVNTSGTTNAPAGVATGAGTANEADARVSPRPNAAAGVGAANAATSKVFASAGCATASGTANNATVNTSLNTNAAAGVATASGTANNATATRSKFASAGVATATGVANNPTVTIRPGNDDFAARIVLAGASGTTTGTNVGATEQDDEPTPPYEHTQDPKSVWYEWSPTTTGLVQVDTIGSSLDTVIACYKGDDFESMLLVGANDDFEDGAGHSRMRMYLFASETYHIQVAGYSGAVGTFVLNWEELGA